MDQYGRWSSDLSDLVHKIKNAFKMLRSRQGPMEMVTWSTPTYKTYVTQRISVALQRSLGIKELKTLLRAFEDAACVVPDCLKGNDWSLYSI